MLRLYTMSSDRCCQQTPIHIAFARLYDLLGKVSSENTHYLSSVYINQFYIALLYIPKVALQSPVVIHTQSYRWW